MASLATVGSVCAASVAQDDGGSNHALLTAKQGRVIVATAREHEPTRRGTQDCSHLVHEIYVRAGFPYPYASSFDLYAGHGSFARVKNPQPGDVIVWPGHAGIVFEPRQHSFYSLVSTGLDTADYEGPYWKSRGKPRFYRYVMGRSGNVLTAGTSPGAAGANSADSQRTARVVESDAGTPAAGGEATREASERSAVYGPADPGVETNSAGAPRSIVLADGKKKPTREEVAEGISELSSAAGAVLRGNRAATAVEPVIVVASMQVSSLELKRDHGWAFVQVESSASIAGEQTDLTKRSEEVRWELRRGKSGWEAVSPLGQTYVPRDVAVRELAGRLAELTQGSGEQAEKARIAKVLNALLGEDSE